jgi:hypothetical protein
MGKPKPGKNMEFDPIEMIEKNAEVNRINQENQYGSSKYITNPDGSQTFKTEFNDDLKGIHADQLAAVKKGSIKNPIEYLTGEESGVGGLASSMFSKMSNRYMGTEGGSDSRHGGMGKGGEPETPPEVPLEGGQPPPAADPMEGMSTSTKVRELQERKKLASEIDGTAQKAPRY